MQKEEIFFFLLSHAKGGKLMHYAFGRPATQKTIPHIDISNNQNSAKGKRRLKEQHLATRKIMM